jgi:hypothetical protein
MIWRHGGTEGDGPAPGPANPLVRDADIIGSGHRGEHRRLVEGYEFLARSGTSLLRETEEALSAYRPCAGGLPPQRRDEALGLFNWCLALWPADGPSRTMPERCHICAAPPGGGVTWRLRAARQGGRLAPAYSPPNSSSTDTRQPGRTRDSANSPGPYDRASHAGAPARATGWRTSIVRVSGSTSQSSPMPSAR